MQSEQLMIPYVLNSMSSIDQSISAKVSPDHQVPHGSKKSVSFYIALDNHKCTHFIKHTKRSIGEKDLMAKYTSHAKRREKFISDRIQRLKARHYQLQYRKMIMTHKSKLMRLKLKAKIDYAQSKASIKRQALLQSNIEKWTARVEYVQNVALIQKFKKLNTLNHVLSESLLDILDQSSQSTLNAPELDPDNFEEDIPLLSPKNLYRFLCEESITEKAMETKTLDPEQYLSLDELSYMDLLPLLPAINRFSLRELDIIEILSSAQTRHDMYFDPSLKFKPNTDGESGEAKKEANAEFWAQVSNELAEGHYYRVPLLLFEIQTIISELLPKSDDIASEVSEWVDVKLVSQQLSHGVFDPFSTIERLGALLLRHCAPIRDESVTAMVETCKSGDFGSTLKKLFEILELMKLDYANYQMNRLRPFVLEKAVDFEWRWFKDRVDCEAIGLDATAQWMAAFGGTPTETLKTRDLFLNAFMELIISIPSLTYSDIPETFSLDHDRIQIYHSQMQDIAIMSYLQMVVKQLLGRKCTRDVLDKVKERQKILINDKDATVEHIVLDLTNIIETARGTALTESETSILNTMVGKSLSSSDSLYNLIINRIKEHLIAIINGGSLDEELLQKHGLALLHKEIEALGNKCKQLFVFHWQVYHELYNSILQI
jgi:hypothetical protein